VNDGSHTASLRTPSHQPPALTAPLPAIATITGTVARHRQPPRLRLYRPPWLLGLILTAQAVLSLRLIPATGAYGDEGLYLWAGHLEWAHWLHGTPTPDFGAYFSGAPAFYPPLGALADSIGGLAGARLLSLALILGATLLLHRVTGRLFGPMAALCAVMMFAGAGATQFLAAFATYDALAIFLLAAATCLAVEASLCRHFAARAALVVASAAALAGADAAKYVAILFDPVVIAIATAAFWRGRRSLPTGIMAGAALTAVFATIAGLAFAAAPMSYLTGITFTTLSRQHGAFPMRDILLVAAGWSGIIVLLAITGLVPVIAASRPGTRALGIAFAAGPLLVPAAAAHAHLFTSMFKHLAYGEWFGAVPAGYALASLIHAVPPVKTRAAARITSIIGTGGALVGAALAGNQYVNMGPDFRLALPAVQAAAAHAAHPVIASDDVDIAQYYAYHDIPGARILAIGPDPHWARANPAQVPRYGRESGLAAYRPAIRHGDLTAVVLSGFHLWGLPDKAVRADLAASRCYRLAASIPYTKDKQRFDYQVWVRR